MHRIVIFSTCEGVDGAAYADALRGALAERKMEFEVQTHACMSNCDRPLSLAFTAPGKATYLFGEVAPDSDLDDTVAFARLYAGTTDGWIDDARPAGRLRHCLVGRVPA